MKFFKNILFIAIAFLIISTIVDYWRRPVAPENAMQQILTDLDGNTLQLAQESAEQPVLLYFWGSWCSVCRLTSPAVSDLAKEGVKVISIALQSGDEAMVKQYLTEHQFVFRTVNDPRGELARAWQVQVTPTLLIIKDGKIHHTTTGWSSEWGLKARLWWAN